MKFTFGTHFALGVFFSWFRRRFFLNYVLFPSYPCGCSLTSWFLRFQLSPPLFFFAFHSSFSVAFVRSFPAVGLSGRHFTSLFLLVKPFLFSRFSFSRIHFCLEAFKNWDGIFLFFCSKMYSRFSNSPLPESSDLRSP